MAFRISAPNVEQHWDRVRIHVPCVLPNTDRDRSPGQPLQFGPECGFYDPRAANGEGNVSSNATWPQRLRFDEVFLNRCLDEAGN